MDKTFALFLLIVCTCVHQSYSLQCWHCSSELDSSCRDPFSFSQFGNRLGSGNIGSNNYDTASSYGNNNDRNDYQTQNRQQYGRQYDDNNRQQYGQYGDNRQQYGGAQQYDRIGQQDPQQQYGRAAQQFSGRQSGAQLSQCNDYDANLKRMKNVCYKRTQTSPNGYVAVIRRCEMVPLDQAVGTCYDPVARGISVNFCEYCEYDGCNSAPQTIKNTLLTVFLPIILLVLSAVYR